MAQLRHWSVDEGKQSASGFAVGCVGISKGLIESNFLHVNAIEHGQGRGDKNDEQTNPISRVDADGQKNNKHAEVGRMPHPAI